ncbi:MAG: thiamine pyrophosphate-binding protein [Candidatus Latescibacterota bacterium]|nr:thiamine pyrophosphate-binding protein [Candidatus Latescibacterota bacterium]
MRGGELLMKCLEAQGVRCVFGMPGTQNLPIYDALRDHGGIDHYLVRHEYSATIAADGFARATGEVGLALTVPGPGASNASTGIVEAFTDCVPVLLMTGQSETRLYERDPAKQFHGLDQMRFFAPVTKYCAIAYQPDDIAGIIVEAFGAMRSGRPGPTMLEFPVDAILGEVSDQSVPACVPPILGDAPAAAELAAAAVVVERMRRPLILVGKAVIDGDARDALRRLAERLEAPVITTRLGKGALPDDHPLALADMRGYLAREAMQVADGLIAAGVRFTSIDSRNWTEAFPEPMVQLDPEPGELGREYACEVGVAGELRGSLRQLAAAVTLREGQEWEAFLKPWRQRFAAQPPLPLLPELRAALSDDGILAVDVHGIGYSTFAEYPVTDPRTYLYPCIGVSLGHAFGQAIGAKVAHPDRPVVAFCGDGGFLMGSCELATVARYGIGVVVVVVNDGALTAIKGSQHKHYQGRTIDTDLTNPDFTKLAEAFGVWAKRVDDVADFSVVLAEAIGVGKPALVEVMLQERQEEAMEWISWLRDKPLRE